MSRIRAAALAAALGAIATTGAHAQDFTPETKGVFLTDLRVSDVFSNANNAIKTSAGAATGLHVKVGDSVMPTLGFTYFLTDHFAVEAILGTTKHTIYAEGAGSKTKVHDTWVLPPVVALQYHFAPRSRINPYVGIGANAMLYYGGSNHNGFKVNLKDNVGAALQAGTDIAVSGPWLFNIDVKKVFVETDAKINGGALTSAVDLNPWVISVGLGRKF